MYVAYYLSEAAPHSDELDQIAVEHEEPATPVEPHRPAPPVEPHKPAPRVEPETTPSNLLRF